MADFRISDFLNFADQWGDTALLIHEQWFFSTIKIISCQNTFQFNPNHTFQNQPFYKKVFSQTNWMKDSGHPDHR